MEKIRNFLSEDRNVLYIVIGVLVFLIIITPIYLFFFSSNVSLSSDKTLIVYSSQTGGLDDNFSPYADTYQTFNNLIYEPLFYYNNNSIVEANNQDFSQYKSNNGKKSYVGLAQTKQWNKKGDQVVVHLNETINWTNGAPFIADDVIYTYKELKKTNLYEPVKYIKTIDRIDTYTLRFVFIEPFKDREKEFFAKFYILPKSQSDKYDISLIKQTHCVATGPFFCSEYKPDGVTFSMNQNYWNKKPDIEKIFYVPDIGASMREILASQVLDIKIIDTSKSKINDRILAEVGANRKLYGVTKFDKNYSFVYSKDTFKNCFINFNSEVERTKRDSYDLLSDYILKQMSSISYIE